jgi:assimilatory nitrate reductase catalytic subunit
MVSRAPGEALSDFRIFRLIAHYAGCHDLFSRWTSPEAVFGLLQELSRGQPCDITGIAGYDMLEMEGGIQWPAPSSGMEIALTASAMSTPRFPTHRRLFEDGRFFTKDERARFVFDEPEEPAEPVDESHPLVLMTGRGTSAQWHTGTRTGKSAILCRMHPSDLIVEVHPDDAGPLSLTTGMWVTVSSRRGSVRARALVTSAVPAGTVFLPMHHPGVNVLTFPSFDPHSRQPSYKHCAVRLTAHPSTSP